MKKNVLMELIFSALEEGIEIKKSDKDLKPFVILEKNGNKEYLSIEGATDEEVLVNATEYIKNNIEKADGAVVVYDGQMVYEGKNSKAVLAKGMDSEKREMYIFGQEYRPKKFLLKFKTSGEIGYVGKE